MNILLLLEADTELIQFVNMKDKTQPNLIEMQPDIIYNYYLNLTSVKVGFQVHYLVK